MVRILWGKWGPLFDKTRSRSNFRPTAVLYGYIHMCIYTYTYTYTYAYAHNYIHTCVHRYSIYIYINSYTHIDTYTSVQILHIYFSCIYIYTDTGIKHVDKYMYVDIKSIHIHIYLTIHPSIHLFICLSIYLWSQAYTDV